MRTPRGVRCDSCTAIEDVNVLAKDRRPLPNTRARFFDFLVPPNRADINPLTGMVRPGKFRGISSESNDKQLAQLNACPECAPKIRKAFKLKDPMLLPQGPLRELMLLVRAKYGEKIMRFQ